MQAAPNLTIMATSRTQLRLRGEKVLSLSGLDYQHEGTAPTANSLDNDAAQMFLLTAKQIKPALDPSQDEMVQINEICRMIEGAPLAVELAARWVDTLPLRTIANELNSDITKLATDLQDLPERQRSMTAVFESSWHRLPESAKRVLARASVFQGGFTLDAAITILGATIQTLSLLVNHSLLRFARAESRYHAHELLRQFASAQLATQPELEHQTRQKHLAYYCQLAEKGELKLRGGDAIDWMKRLGHEKGNWQIAFEWGYEHYLEMTAQMAVHLSLFWFSSGQMQLGQKLYGKLLSKQNELPDQVRGWVLTWYTAMIWVQGRLQESKELALEAYHIFQKLEDSAGIVMSYHHQSAVAFYQGDLESAISFGEKALEIARNDITVPQWFLSVCLQGQSTCLAEGGQEEEAYRIALECLKFCEENGNFFTGTYAMAFLARHAIRKGELVEANTLCQQGLTLAQDLNDRRMESIQYLVLGNIALAERDFLAAVGHLETAVAISDLTNNTDILDEATMLLGRDAYTGIGEYELAFESLQRWAKICLQLNNTANMAACLEKMAAVHWRLNPGNFDSVYWLAASAAWRNKMPDNELIRKIQQQLSEAEFQQSWERGFSLALQDALMKAAAT
jgi:predicted ATPase